jgi:hypothetical protein
MRKIILIAITFLLMMLSGCATFKSKSETFPLMYTQRPLTVLTLPPINLSTAPEAKEYFMTTLSETVSQTGYYFLPLEVTTPLLKAEGLYDTEIITDDVLPQFKEFFDADAVLITKILEWDKSYYVVGGNVTVALDFSLISTTTGKVLWNYNGRIVYSTTSNSNQGLLVALVETAVKTAAQDYVPIARAINQKVFQTVPVGKYNPRCDKDQADQVKVE